MNLHVDAANASLERWRAIKTPRVPMGKSPASVELSRRKAMSGAASSTAALSTACLNACKSVGTSTLGETGGSNALSSKERTPLARISAHKASP